MTMAAALGLRPFDASLIIAIVQDSARRGVPALGAETEHRVGMVAPAHAAAPGPLALLAASIGLGLLICVAAAAWVVNA